jgi:hypothetical protein
MEGIMMFFHLFPELAAQETRTAMVLPGHGPLPPDNYGFTEAYCIDPKCDCRRVLINVLAEGKLVHLATISHAFKAPSPDSHTPEQTFLDPLNPQSRWSPALLDLFQEILEDKEYCKRLERHYRMVKEALRNPAHRIHQVIASSQRATSRHPKGNGPVEPTALSRSGRKSKRSHRRK